MSDSTDIGQRTMDNENTRGAQKEVGDGWNLSWALGGRLKERAVVGMLVCTTAAAAILPAGCATSGGNAGESLRQARAPAWSLKQSPEHLVVAVSPVRQTFQIAGSIGTVLGASITVAQNAAYKADIESALGDYDTVKLVEDRTAALTTRMVGNGRRVAPFDVHVDGDIRQAEHERYRRLAREGHDEALDLTVTHGIYGVEGDLVVRVRGELHQVPSGRLLWRRAVAVRSGPPLACRPLGDPTQRLLPNITDPRLTSKAGAVTQWTEDHGAHFKAEFERSLDGALAAVEMSLGGSETADGLLVLGLAAMYKKDFSDAGRMLEKAHALAPARTDISNAQSVVLGHEGRVEEAIAMAEGVTEADPSNGVAELNLAWWYGIEKQCMERARSHYEKALKLRMPEVPKLRKILGVSTPT